jgi:protein-L-isoaspartate(D-aspartate) O-methyltransferase
MLNNKDLIRKLKIEGISDKNILHAIEKVPRELFVAQEFIDRAYENIPLPIDCSQTISQPYVVAYMISCLKLKKTDKILEIGTGTGYQTAILSYLCKEVCTIEIYNKLLNQAKKRILKLNLKNINFTLGNGVEGWDTKVLFDAIIVSAASEIIPDKLLKNLKNNGCLIMPKKKSLDIQKLLLIKKSNETYLEKELCSVKFVPLLNNSIE